MLDEDELEVDVFPELLMIPTDEDEPLASLDTSESLVSLTLPCVWSEKTLGHAGQTGGTISVFFM